MRGKVLKLSPEERVSRALEAAYAQDFIQYSLKPGQNGGTDPEAAHCASSWQSGKRMVYTSDCVGFALWAYGADRYQPRGPAAATKWLNTTSIWKAAQGLPWAQKLEVPTPGCLVVYPASLLRGRPYGHIGVYVGNDRVVHCHGPRLAGPAITLDPLKKFSRVKGWAPVELHL